MKIPRRGFMLCLSSPSGAGKTSICNRILELDNKTTLSVSVTTRPKRPGEIDGEDYFFVTPDDYKKMVDDSGKRGGEIGIIDGIACALQHCSAWP